MSGSGYTCIRRIFCWLNCILWLSGCGIFGVGLWLRFAYEGYVSLLPQYALLSAESICITVGVITFILAFFGCCGSWFQNRCLLITYFSCVVLMFEIEFFLGSLAFIFRERLGHQLRYELKDGIQHHYNITVNIPNGLVTIWDKVNTQFKCCGVDSYTNWFRIDAWPEDNYVPDSCCVDLKTGCGQSHNPNLWYERGCSDQVHMWFVERLHIIGVIGLAVAFIQLFGLISSMLLFCTVRHKRSTHSYKSFPQQSPTML